MLLTVSTTADPATGDRPASDLGHLLRKHPDRAQAFDVAAGTAHVFYPSAGPEECTAALLLEIDPVVLARGRSRGAPALGSYVDDQPYAAGSMLAVALATVFSSALKGGSVERADLAATALGLSVRLPTLPCRGDGDLVERLFGPLGWTVHGTPVPLDPAHPEWGDSRFRDTTLTGRHRVADALAHLYVLLPVLDGAKHYRVGPDEVDKLLRAGDRWLAGHPEKELISERYLRHHRFEWTRAQFRSWAGGVGERRGYDVRHLPVGPDDAEVGAPTQLAVLTRQERS